MQFHIFDQNGHSYLESFEADNCSKAAEYMIAKLGVVFGVDKNGYKTVSGADGKPLAYSLIAPLGYLVDLTQPSLIEVWIRRACYF